MNINWSMVMAVALGVIGALLIAKMVLPKAGINLFEAD